MAEIYQRRSALTHFGLALRMKKDMGRDSDVFLSEGAPCSLVNIRGSAKDETFRKSVQFATGVALPRKANSVESVGERRIFWLGPNEWLVRAEDGASSAIVDALRTSFAAQHASAVDLSESRAIITIAGPKARDFLARGISIDLHPRAFKVGECAQTGMSRCNILLHLTSDQPSFDLYVLRSFSDYLWRWIEATSIDYNTAIVD